MRVWSCANQKGGVGKTTSVVTLGGLLANKGYRVLLIDFDPHASLTSYFGVDSDDLEATAYDLFEAARDKNDLACAAKRSILSTMFNNLNFIPGSLALATLDKQLSKLDGMGLVLKNSLQTLASSYDHVIIDCPPVVGILMINALASSEHLIIPVQTEFLAIKGLERMIRTINMVIKAQHHDLRYTILPTMFDRRTKASVQSLSSLQSSYSDAIWSACIPIDTRFRDASKLGQPPSFFDSRSRGVIAYERFLNDIKDEKDESSLLIDSVAESEI